MNDTTDAGAQLVLFLVGGTLSAFAFTMLWDFIRGLMRG